MQRDEQWVQVTTAPSQIEAALMRDLLVGEGMASLVQTSDAAAYLGVISPCVLLVRQSDLDRAQEFLKAWETSSIIEPDMQDSGDGNIE